MKATVVSVFKSRDYVIKYCYHNTKKCNDDVEDISFSHVYPPMMEIRLWKEDYNKLTENAVEINTQIVFASPAIVEKYTGFDLFDSQIFYRFYGKAINIEFEWKEKDYPYLKTYNSRDYITTEKLRIPEITFIEDTRADNWEY